MFNWLKKLFKDKYACDHEFSHWEIMKEQSNNYGQVRVHQLRMCKKCKYCQIDVQEK